MLWTIDLPEQPQGGPAAGEDVAFVALLDETLVAYDLISGEEKWTARLGAEPQTGPVYADGVVIVADASRQLAAFSAQTGKRLWRVKLEAQPSSQLGIGPDTVCLGEANMACVAFGVKDGSRRWRVGVVGDVAAMPWVGSKRVVFGSTGHKIHSMAIYTGEAIAEATLSGEAVGSPGAETMAARKPMTCVGTHDGRLYALGESLQKVWAVNVHGIVRAAPLPRPDAVYAGTDQGMLYRFHKTSGEVIWRKGVGGPVVDSLVPLPGTLAAGAGGALYFLADDSGETKREFTCKGRIRGIAADNGIVVATTTAPQLVAAGLRYKPPTPEKKPPVLVSVVVDPARINPARGQETVVTFSLRERVPLTVDVADVRGSRVRLVAQREQAEPGTYRFRWDGLGEKEARIDPGIYRLRISAGKERANVGIEVTARR